MDATHNNIELKYATAYVKRLQQFVKHCDSKLRAALGPNYGNVAMTGKDRYVHDRSLSPNPRMSFNTAAAAASADDTTKPPKKSYDEKNPQNTRSKIKRKGCCFQRVHSWDGSTDN